MKKRTRPKRRLTGSEPGKLCLGDVKVSVIESAGWTASIAGLLTTILTFLEWCGYELRDALPSIAMAFPMEVVAGVAAAAGVFILASKLWSQRQNNNRSNGEK